MKSKKTFQLFNVENKNIILTGSAGILGTQYAYALSEQGANLILIDIDSKKNKKLEQELREKFHTNPTSFHADITKSSQIKKVTKSVLQKYKKIDGLVNNAVFHPKTKAHNISKPFTKFPKELLEKSINVDLTGLFVMCQEIGTIMEKQKHGIIVNISSIYGIKGADQRIYGKSKLNSPPSYALTKGAIINFSRYLAAYWYDKNIRVNTLSLGGVKVEEYMTKEFIKQYSKKTILGRMANVDEYNGPLLFLLSNASSYMTGSNLIVDGGWSAW
jgi:NAD(P)-dependent dehydrogenase (short-subunit alcohol dehydrogenase family)